MEEINLKIKVVTKIRLKTGESLENENIGKGMEENYKNYIKKMRERYKRRNFRKEKHGQSEVVEK